MSESAAEAVPEPESGEVAEPTPETAPTPDPAPTPETAPDRLAVALVRGAHGLRGAVRVEILTDKPELRYGVGSVLHREGSTTPLTITWSSAVADGPGWRLQFAEVRDRSGAEDLHGTYLEVQTGPDATLPRGAYFWHEVVGTTVTSTSGEVLGTIRDVYRSGGAEVYVVDGGDYGEFDVPAVRDFIRIFAPRRGEVVVDTEALDLSPPKRRHAPDDPDRPRAPRRRAGSRHAKPIRATPAAQPDRATGRPGEASRPSPSEEGDPSPTEEPATRSNPFDVLAD